jgi:hypothetical protein
VTLSSSWSSEPRASGQLWNAQDTPMSAAAGMVVTEMNTPSSALVRDYCVTGLEAGCATVVEVVPVADPAVGAAVVVPVAFGAMVLYRRRAAAK